MTRNSKRRFSVASIILLLGLTTGPLAADAIYQTDGPFGGMFGLWGYDISSDQTVGLRFIPNANYTLDTVKLWFMSNDWSGQTHPAVTITLRDDYTSGTGASIPGHHIYESWTFNVSAVGWNPVEEVMSSLVHPRLIAGRKYWIVAESPAPGGDDGVWNMAAFGTGFMANTNNGQWQPGNEGAVTSTTILGTPSRPGDIDGDSDVDESDLAAFLSVLLGTSPNQLYRARSDLNGDGLADGRDVRLFVAAFLGG